MSSPTAKFDDIQNVSKGLILNANEYANASRHVSKDGLSEQIGKWFPDYRVINYRKPFFRTIEGHDNTVFLLDIDVVIDNEADIEKYYEEDELREIKLRTAMQYFENWLKERPHLEFFANISGKGLYLMQLYDKAVPKDAFFPIVWNGKKGLFSPCTGNHKTIKPSCDGWHLQESELIRKIVRDRFVISLKIDLRMMNGVGGRLFRLPYSPYYKLTDIYHAVPVIIRDGEWQIEETIRKSRLHTMEVEPYEVPPFQFEDKLEAITDLRKTVSHHRLRKDTIMYKIDVPEPEEELNLIQLQMLDDMEAMVSSDDVNVTPPCIRRSFLRDPENPVDRHFSRVNVLRYLAVKGNYSPSEIGTFIRFRVNDEEDNRPENKHTLHQQVPYWYGDPENPDKPAGCSVLQDPRNRFFACGDAEKSICTRPGTPLASQKRKKVVKKLKIKRKRDDKNKIENKTQIKTFEEMSREIRKILENGDTNYEIIKTTRAGVTTTLINESVNLGKKLLVVIPTNAIGEKTGSDAFWLLKTMYQIDVRGAIFTSNKKGCLKLQLKRERIRDRKSEDESWGEEGLAYDKLAFHFKESCITLDSSCRFLNDHFDIPNFDTQGVPLPVIKSRITMYDRNSDAKSLGLCAYQTVIQNLDNLDVLFITYDKLQALSLSDDEAVLTQLFDVFDTIFLDEISQFAQKNSNAISLLTLDDDNREYSLISELNDEIAVLEIGRRYDTIRRLIHIIEQFRDTYEGILLEWESRKKFGKTPFIEKFDNFLDESDRYYLRENFSAFYSVIQQFAEEGNIHLKNIEKILLLVNNESWWIQNIPTYERKIDCSIISSPVVNYARKFVQMFNLKEGKQVIVTDATMPMIKMSELFKIPFERYVIGDPRNTNDHQLIIADSKKVYPFRFFSGGKDSVLDQLEENIKFIVDKHGGENVMLVLPNSNRIYRYIKNLQNKGKLSNRVEVTYYRSDKTLGIASDRRIMIAVCAPYPPSGAFMWLASYYHEIGLYHDIPIIELSRILEEMNAHQTFYQTIGRAKSPNNAERSIVYAWGIDKETLDMIIQMDSDVPIPHITSLVYQNSKVELLSYIADVWLQYHMVVHPVIIRIMLFLRKKSKQKFTLSMIKRQLRLNSQDVEHLKATNSVIFDHFGIFYEEGERGRIYLYAN